MQTEKPLKSIIWKKWILIIDSTSGWKLLQPIKMLIKFDDLKSSNEKYKFLYSKFETSQVSSIYLEIGTLRAKDLRKMYPFYKREDLPLPRPHRL